MAIIGTGQFAVKRIETAQPKVIVRPSADVIISGEAFSPATIAAQRVLKVGDREEVLDKKNLAADTWRLGSPTPDKFSLQIDDNLLILHCISSRSKEWSYVRNNAVIEWKTNGKYRISFESKTDYWYSKFDVEITDDSALNFIVGSQFAPEDWQRYSFEFVFPPNRKTTDVFVRVNLTNMNSLDSGEEYPFYKLSIRDFRIEEIDIIEYAGRNLLLNSTFRRGLVFDTLNVFPLHWQGWNRKAVNSNKYGSGFTCFTHESKSTNASIETLVPLQKNTQYTLSFSAYVAHSLRLQPMLRYINNDNSESYQTIAAVNGQSDKLNVINNKFTSAAQFKEVSLLLVTDMLVNDNSAQIFLSPIKLELGERATTWSPAPEDATLTLNDAPYTPNDEVPASLADRFTFASDWNGQRDSRTVAVTPGASLDYLKEAISKGKIVHKGGLFLSNILAVQDINGSDDEASIRAGMSGLNNDGVAFFADPTNAYRKATDYLTGASHIKPQYMVDDRGCGTWGVMDVLPDRVVISNAARNQVILCNDINSIINEPQNISLSQSGVSSVGYIYLSMDYVTPGYPQRKIITLLDETVDVPMAYRFERVQPFVDLNVSVDCQKVSQGPSGLVEKRSTATIDMKIRTLIYNNDKLVAQTDWMTHTQHVEGQYRGQNTYYFSKDNVTAVNMRKGTLRTVVEGYYSVSLYAGTEIDDVGDKIPIGAYYSIFYGLEIEDMKFYNNRIIISSDGIYADLTDNPNEVSTGMMMRDKTGAVRINDTSFRPDIAGVVGGAEVTMSGVAMTAKKNFMGGTVYGDISRISKGCYEILVPDSYRGISYNVVVTLLGTSPRIAVVNKSSSSFEILTFPYNSAVTIDTSFSFIIFAV